MKEIRSEIKKLDSITSERVLYNVKHNKKVEQFRAIKLAS